MQHYTAHPDRHKKLKQDLTKRCRWLRMVQLHSWETNKQTTFSPNAGCLLQAHGIPHETYSSIYSGAALAGGLTSLMPKSHEVNVIGDVC